jgi:hypothetical protein
MKPVNVDGYLVPVCGYCFVLCCLVDRGEFKRWECPEEGCDARVGVHRDSPRFAPLGTPARHSLRVLRQEVHGAFDPLWAPGDLRVFASRTEAYRWLAGALNLPAARCHVAEFDQETCLRALGAITHFRNSNNG